MNNIGVISYGLGGLSFVLLASLLLTSWKGRIKGGLLVVAVVVSAIWNFIHVYDSIYYTIPESLMVALDVFKLTSWIVFLLELLNSSETKIVSDRIKRSAYVVISSMVIMSVGIYVYENKTFGIDDYLVISLYCVLVLSLGGLVFVEQLYRNTSTEQLWAIKYLFLGLAGMFVYDIFLYSNNILFKEISSELWDARGAVYMILVPLFAISAARNPEWSLGVHVSRNVVFYTASMLSVGFYLLVISISGYYIKLYGGGWGTFAQILFVTLTGIVLSVLLFSGHVRARVKQFVGTNFYSYKYDYRDEWLRLMRILSESDKGGMLIEQRVIKAVSQIVQSPAGCLWVKNEGDLYIPVAHWNMQVSEDFVLKSSDKLIAYVMDNQSIINLYEYTSQPDLYNNLTLPTWIDQINKAWLIVPVFLDTDLYGFIILTRSIGIIEQTWEDGELLFTVGQQVASYLAQHESAQKLAESRQFDAFNRLSAYIVHDLKNVVAQLDLVVSNSVRHKSNPEFVDDVISTVNSAVNKMNKMLSQLKKSRFSNETVSKVNVDQLLEKVIEQRSSELPIPILEKSNVEVCIEANSEKMLSVIGHLVQNAQEATPDDGKVHISLEENKGMVIIRIIDNGIGMNQEFILNRLFKPFDTTKGNAGMGIGVYESREYIQNLGGHIKATSEPDKGTVMTITLPASSY